MPVVGLTEPMGEVGFEVGNIMGKTSADSKGQFCMNVPLQMGANDVYLMPMDDVEIGPETHVSVQRGEPIGPREQNPTCSFGDALIELQAPEFTAWNVMPLLGRGPAGATAIVNVESETYLIELGSTGEFCQDIPLAQGMNAIDVTIEGEHTTTTLTALVTVSDEGSPQGLPPSCSNTF